MNKGNKRSHVLNATDKEVMIFIQNFIQTNGYPPSLREIGNACGFTSTSSVSFKLTKLERFGHIRLNPNTARSIVVLKEIE